MIGWSFRPYFRETWLIPRLFNDDVFVTGFLEVLMRTWEVGGCICSLSDDAVVGVGFKRLSKIVKRILRIKFQDLYWFCLKDQFRRAELHEAALSLNAADLMPSDPISSTHWYSCFTVWRFRVQTYTQIASILGSFQTFLTTDGIMQWLGHNSFFIHPLVSSLRPTVYSVYCRYG